ncbi:MAG TPA: LLM class F420-dependent oxidoreductase [Ktedonobacteraceae bacterium]|jgi:probable F420-dependent oxidoreductase|nr:LLM class F420-dependent oxidoreductase [Ktedonobacteraceae bacterium]
MQFGVTFPQSEIGTDKLAIRDYAQAAEALGYKHLLAYDHVLGADPANRPGWTGYTHETMFHEPFVLFGYLAALTNLEMVTDVIILPQRQTALVAKQAAEVDVLTGGKLRLGVGLGWNAVEYEGLGLEANFHSRGKIFEEQIEVLRLLWSKEIISYKGKYHSITEAGLNPLPVKRSIPVWIGGGPTEKVLRRVARIADGWFPLDKPGDSMRQALENLHQYLQEEGRDPASLGIEAVMRTGLDTVDEWARQTEAWQKLGATHISISTMGSGFKTVDAHIDALRRYKEATA